MGLFSSISAALTRPKKTTSGSGSGSDAINPGGQRDHIVSSTTATRRPDTKSIAGAITLDAKHRFVIEKKVTGDKYTDDDWFGTHRDAFLAQCKTDGKLEAFYCLEAMHKGLEKESIYNTFIGRGGSALGLSDAILDPLRKLAADGRYDEMELYDVRKAVRESLRPSRLAAGSKAAFRKTELGEHRKGDTAEPKLAARPTGSAGRWLAKLTGKVIPDEDTQQETYVRSVRALGRWRLDNNVWGGGPANGDALERALKPPYKSVFLEFAKAEFAPENIECYLAITEGTLSDKEIVSRFLSGPQSPQEVNVATKEREPILQAVAENRAPDYEQLLKAVKMNLSDTYSRLQFHGAFLDLVGTRG